MNRIMSQQEVEARRKLKILRDEFAARNPLDFDHWVKLPRHHRELLLTLTGQPDKLAGRQWFEIDESARKEIGSLARTLAKSLGNHARGLV
jgi:hypothetical protein